MAWTTWKSENAKWKSLFHRQNIATIFWKTVTCSTGEQYVCLNSLQCFWRYSLSLPTSSLLKISQRAPLVTGKPFFWPTCSSAPTLAEDEHFKLLKAQFKSSWLINKKHAWYLTGVNPIFQQFFFQTKSSNLIFHLQYQALLDFVPCASPSALLLN